MYDCVQPCFKLDYSLIYSQYFILVIIIIIIITECINIPALLKGTQASMT